MCGFIGSTLRKENIENYYSILSHRGPDDAKHWKDNFITLVHNRLSVIDLNQRSNQPMVDPSSRNVIVFNGEIYNYKDLKRKYSQLKFTTRSDTEVILKLFDHLGPNFVHELNGIFSFVIYSQKTRKLFFYTDRFGVKPLYFHIEGKNISFSSEIKGILSFTNKKEPDYVSISDYLKFGLLHHDENTWFERINSVPPATILTYDMERSSLESKVYWDLISQEFNLSGVELEKKAQFLLDDALNKNLVADTDIGLSLSSGLDSNLLKGHYETNIKKPSYFTFGFKERTYDEVSKLKELKQQKDNWYQSFLSEKDYLDELRSSLYFFEGPLGGLGTLSAFSMMKIVKEKGIKVMLSGEGADECFGGYQYYYTSHLRDLFKSGKDFHENLKSYCLTHDLNFNQTLKVFQKPEKKESRMVKATDGTTTQNIKLGKEISKLDVRDSKYLDKYHDSILREAIYKDVRVLKLPKLLHFQDRAGMSSGVEVRVPFLDHRLFELMFSSDGKDKFTNGSSKSLLRKIYENKTKKEWEISTKHYVATPQREWLKTRTSKNRILEEIKYGYLVKNNIIDFSNFYSNYEKYSNQKELGNSFFIWKVINTEYFCKEFFEN